MVRKSRKRELLKKVTQVKQGMGTRPPKEWWGGMRKLVKKGYPGRSEQSISRISAGIWHKYTPEAKIGIIRRIAGGKGGVPRNEQNPKPPFKATKLIEHEQKQGDRYNKVIDYYGKMSYAGQALAGIATDEQKHAIALHELKSAGMIREQNPYMLMVQQNPQSVWEITNRIRWNIQMAADAVEKMKFKEAKRYVGLANELWNCALNDADRDKYRILGKELKSINMTECWTEQNPKPKRKLTEKQELAKLIEDIAQEQFGVSYIQLDRYERTDVDEAVAALWKERHEKNPYMISEQNPSYPMTTGLGLFDSAHIIEYDAEQRASELKAQGYMVYVTMSKFGEFLVYKNSPERASVMSDEAIKHIVQSTLRREELPVFERSITDEPAVYYIPGPEIRPRKPGEPITEMEMRVRDLKIELAEKYGVPIVEMRCPPTGRRPSGYEFFRLRKGMKI